MLFSFILQAQQDGLRNVLVIHGKGRDDNAHANIVRSYVARWLTEFDDVGPTAPLCRITAAAGHAMWHYVKPRRQNRKTGSVTPSAAADQRIHQAASTLFLPSCLALYNASSTRLNNSSILSFVSCRATPMLTVKRGRPWRVTFGYRCADHFCKIEGDIQRGSRQQQHKFFTTPAKNKIVFSCTGFQCAGQSTKHFIAFK